MSAAWVKDGDLKLRHFVPRPPQENNDPMQLMETSWYCLSGKKMADGNPMRCNYFTAASNTFPLGTLLFLENPASEFPGLYVVVTDRGPFIEPRLLDVSQGVARKLGFEKKGVITLNVRVVSGYKPCVVSYGAQ